MQLTAAVATAAVALLAAVAVGGFEVAGVQVAPAVYGLALGAAVAAVASGRRPRAPAVPVPEWIRRNGRVLGMVAGVAVLAAPARAVAFGEVVVVLAAAGALATAWWWPRPGFLRASVALSALALFRPGADPTAHAPVLGAMGLAAAVALVASSRLAAAEERPLDPSAGPPRAGRLAGEAAVVALALLAGALLSSQMEPPQPRFGAGDQATGDLPEEEQPAPLDLLDSIDPIAAGRGGRGGQDRVLLKVGSDRAMPLRAVTYDEWDGRRWSRSADLEAPSAEGRGRFVYVLGEVDPPGGRVMTQRVRIEASFAAVAVGTPRVFVYELPGGGQSDLDGTVRLLPPLGKGATYTARVAPTEASAGELRTSRAAAGFPFYGPELEEPGAATESPHVSARPALSERAVALVDRVTAGAATDYDKVQALSDHLAATVTYDDKVAALPAGTDVVDDVLFGSRRASQQRLATTLVLLTRAAGLPARMATGFLPGQRPFLGGDFVVRARDAHTWVEVPFEGHGWQRFDPSGRIADAQKADSLWNRLKRAWHRYWPVFLLVIGVVAALVAVKLVRWRRRIRALPWATRYWARLVRLGRRRGRAHLPAETPAEYTRALAEGVLMDDRLVEVGRVVTAAAWSPTEPEPSTKEWAEKVLVEAKAQSRGAKRKSRAG